MPANETVWRNLKRMHVIFAVSSAALLVTVVWMLAGDHADPWRDFQRTSEKIVAEKLRADMSEYQRDPERVARVREVQEQLEEARVAYEATAQERAELERKLAAQEHETAVAEERVRDRRAFLDKRRADYDLAVRDALSPARLAELLETFEDEQRRVDRLVIEHQEKAAELAELRAQLAAYTKERDEAQAELRRLETDLDLKHAALMYVEPDDWFSAAKRKIMGWPIIDGFNSPIEVKHDWMPDLRVKLGMSSAARFDNCRTCHLLIDRVQAGNIPEFPHGHPQSDDIAGWVAENKFPHPYATHPRPDLYITASSPHPAPPGGGPGTFGCTVCHEGQGSATSFDNAEHTADNPHQSHVWDKKHGHHPNHYWEYPMYSGRLLEATCLKCHHQVEELGENPTYGASAPKVVEGYHLIQDYGCFGCHEVQGFDDTRSIGPDIRLEPNYTAVAEQLLRDPFVLAQSEQKRRANGAQVPAAPAPANVGPAAEAPGEAATSAATAAASPLSLDEIREMTLQVNRRPNETATEKAALRTAVRGDVAALARAVAAKPFESTADRQRLYALIEADRALARFDMATLSRSSQNMLDELKDFAHPGTMRKVGPALRHIALKTTPEWVEYWTEEPKRFRPDTRMPQFFHLSNQHDPHAEELMPVELAGIAQYLMAKSQPLDLMSPPEGYQPDAARGAESFAQRGCLACHSHEKFPGSEEDFGPDLSKVHAKLKPGDEGRRWLYTWISDPQRYHPRSKMPNLFLEPEGEGDSLIDPAADIAEFLLQGGPGEYEAAEWKPYLGIVYDETFTDDTRRRLKFDRAGGVRVLGAMEQGPAVRAMRTVGDADVLAPLRMNDVILTFDGAPVSSAAEIRARVEAMRVGEKVALGVWRSGAEQEHRLIVSDPLDDLTRMFLSKNLTAAKVEQTFQDRNYPLPVDQIKGDEIELARAADSAAPDEAAWREMKLNYVGRRTISRYGCYGCHDVPEFETARPIGTTLQDWGRKDVTRLAPEHIHEYLHHHGEPDGGSTHERVAEALRVAESGSFASEEDRDREMSAAYFYHNLINHGRDGFLWQKLRDPRSYDFEKIETRGYDERLRMPKFPLDEEQIEAISTFVLGLVAEPPAEQYIYQPTGPAADRIAGEGLLRKYNCTACHMVELPFVKYVADPAMLPEGRMTDADHPEALDLLLRLKPPRDGRTGETLDSGEAVIGFHGLLVSEPDPEEEEELQEFYFDLWETLQVGEKRVFPGSRMIVPKTTLQEIEPARGGDFALWLVDRLKATPAVRDNTSLAWQMSPPPLYKEGIKVQNAWLYRFLREPDRLRFTTVLRMPKFNLAPDEAQALADYFAAVDGASYPYQAIPQREPPYLHAMEQALGPILGASVAGAGNQDSTGGNGEMISPYLNESWEMLNAPLCIKCHSVGGRQVQIQDPATDIRGPDLRHTADRLRPDWLQLWLYKPSWITPYTSMPAPRAANSRDYLHLFDGQPGPQTIALRDALMNYHRILEARGRYEEQSPAAELGAPETNGAEPAPAPAPADNDDSTNAPAPAAARREP
ncbi:MAG: PDZ domain-containing protein [Planctomycetaceae bacterium]